MKNLYCHIKANLRYEKRLLKCLPLERDLHSNFRSAYTTREESRLAKGAGTGASSGNQQVGMF